MPAFIANILEGKKEYIILNRTVYWINKERIYKIGARE
jgi:hypothetical protein